MTEGNKDIRPGEVESKEVVELDKTSPVLQRARELMARAVIKERLAILGEIQALEDSVFDLWREMPLVARGHESSLEDGAEGDGSPGAGDSEFDDSGGVPAC